MSRERQNCNQESEDLTCSRVLLRCDFIHSCMLASVKAKFHCDQFLVTSS